MKSYGGTIQMKATDKYFPMVLFIMLYNVVLAFVSVADIYWCDNSNEFSSAEHVPYFRFAKISSNYYTWMEFEISPFFSFYHPFSFLPLTEGKGQIIFFH